MIVGSLFSSFGIILCLRWLVLFFIFEHSRTHMPSLVLASITLSIGFLFYGIGILSDLISVNRELMQEIRDNQKNKVFNLFVNSMINKNLYIESYKKQLTKILSLQDRNPFQRLLVVLIEIIGTIKQETSQVQCPKSLHFLLL